MTDHRHLIKGRVSEVLALGWCECGEEYLIEKDRWREPRTAEGRMRRFRWIPEEAES